MKNYGFFFVFALCNFLFDSDSFLIMTVESLNFIGIAAVSSFLCYFFVLMVKTWRKREPLGKSKLGKRSCFHLLILILSLF